jgi:hypothetical protein
MAQLGDTPVSRRKDDRGDFMTATDAIEAVYLNRGYTLYK